MQYINNYFRCLFLWYDLERIKRFRSYVHGRSRRDDSSNSDDSTGKVLDINFLTVSFTIFIRGYLVHRSLLILHTGLPLTIW